MSDVRVTSRNDGVINRILFIRSPLLNTNALRLFNPANPRLKSGICEVIIDNYLHPLSQVSVFNQPLTRPNLLIIFEIAAGSAVEH